ncbi:MAG: DUF2188 domain-containing protein [Flavobacteriales bacterium]|nr:DUF2188 domain-containing protein [Flavobacteriales bacterium]
MQHTYNVTIRPDGQWQGGRENARVPFFLANTQQEAEETMCEIAMQMGHSRVLIFGAEGELLRDREFGRAKAIFEVLVGGGPRPDSDDLFAQASSNRPH